VHITKLLRKPEAVVEDMKPEDCETILAKVWDPVVGKKKQEITDDAQTITSTLVGADKSVKIYWLKYYDFAGTGSVRVPVKVPGFKPTEIRIGPLLPKGCFKPFDKRRDEINKWVASGVAKADGAEHPHVAFVSTAKLDGDDNLMQPLVVGKGVLREIEKGILSAADKVIGGTLEKVGGELDKARQALEKEEGSLKAKKDELAAKEQDLQNETNAAKRAVIEAAIKTIKVAITGFEKAVDLARKAVAELEKGVNKLDEKFEAGIDPSEWGLTKEGHEVGWPHPSLKGHQTIAAEVVKLLPAAK
jgi:hypothetical protein